MANGVCDNLLLATYLSATCPVVVAPAMDEDMWLHPATKRNIQTVKEFGNTVIPVSKGELASGLFGEGRMAEPEQIILYLVEKYFRRKDLHGKLAIVTAGPTFEAIDPVRFIGNHSSGKMGYSIAEALYERGATVKLISGPVGITTQYQAIEVIKVTSAEEMYSEVITVFPSADVTVMAAAVADYTPEHVSTQKIKKNDALFSLNLLKTRDILKTLGEVKRENQLIVGFALETENEKENALKKLHEKNADFLVLNSLKDPEAGFKKDTNKVTIFDKTNNTYSFDAKSKKLVAEDIVELIIKKLHEKA